MVKRKKKVKYLIFGFSLIILSLSIVIYKHYSNYYENRLEENKIEIFFENSKKENKNNDVITINNFKSNEHYIAIIEIPKISLKKGLYTINSKLNDVNKNIQILKESTMPNEENSNLILASHSGSSRKSYFKNINKLENEDLIYIYYNNIIYTYKVVDKYEIEKTGYAVIKENTNKKVLTLITCKINTNKQIVIVSELIDEKSY